MNIHDRARQVSVQKRISIQDAYRLLSLRGQATQRWKRTVKLHITPSARLPYADN